MKLGKTAKFFLDGVIYIVIVGGIVYGLPKFLSWSLKTPFPMAAITSGSMWPQLKEGDMVFIQGAQSKDTIAEGDVVVWRSTNNEGFVIHRVIELKEDTFITKGDGNFTADPPVGYDQLVGKALVWRGKMVKLPYLGSVTTYASKFVQ